MSMKGGSESMVCPVTVVSAGVLTVAVWITVPLTRRHETPTESLLLEIWNTILIRNRI